MSASQTGRLRVPGAVLHYKVRGSGPLLLLLPSGGGDADTPDGIADVLAERYTVLSYDRRGLSRSGLDDDAPPPCLETHSDDAQRLLASRTEHRALVFGCSTGAVIGLDLALRHPGRVRTLVAHEPPAVTLLDAAEREAALRLQERMEATYRAEGRISALRTYAKALGGGLMDREPGVVWSRPGPREIANMDRFLAHDAGATCRYSLTRVGRAALRTSPVRIVPAVGASSARSTAYQGAVALAGLLACEPVEFPGGHEGYLTHPRAFSAALHALLDGSATPPSVPTSPAAPSAPAHRSA
ncbi:alpha/beta fold hydrolase [Kitasatospora sp. NPDC049285]|uniref:alpha/beta fold hydrolase n=1 Tax=Kitasatospora sp. NPDC049285 TaxID=3157096 RepID=UPI0034491738